MQQRLIELQKAFDLKRVGLVLNAPCQSLLINCALITAAKGQRVNVLQQSSMLRRFACYAYLFFTSLYIFYVVISWFNDGGKFN